MFKRAQAYLGVIFAIFLRDVKRVLRNPIALIVVLGMAVIPSAYAWYVVAANWDPYNNTASMKVAVANNDQGADSPVAGSLDVGAQVVDQLKDNHELGWEFTDTESAINGVYEGRYWAALVIPENFSEDFASVFTGHFTKPSLDYYVNEKPSSIAPKVTDAGAQAVQKAIDENFVKTVSEKVVDTTQDAGAYAEEKGDASEKSLASGLKTAHDTVANTRDTLTSLQKTVASTRTSVSHAADTITGAQNDVPHLLEALSDSQTLLSDARTAANAYGAEVAKNAVDGALKLSAAATSAQQALGSVEGAVSQAETQTNAALADAKDLLAANKKLIAALEKQAPDNATITSAVNQAQEAGTQLEQTVQSLTDLSSSLSSTASSLEQEASALDQAAQSGASTIQSTAQQFQSSVLPNLSSSLDDLVSACGTLEGALKGIEPSLAQCQTLLKELDNTLETAETSLGTTASSLTAMEKNLDRSLKDLTALQDSATVKDLATYLKINPDDIGSFMASPVALKTVPVYPVKNYGSGVAPFFTNLALWVAGFILMAIVRLRVDPTGLPKFTPTQAYFGRWLFYVVIGLAQGLICCAGDLLMGIQCESPAAFIGAGLLTVFVDVNLMYALAYAFRHIGKAIAVILLIMQIPGSSGMFPIEMMPAFFQAIHPLLPFTYSIDAMREAIGGFYGLNYLRDMLLLGLLFVPAGFLIGLGLGRADFNLNVMFDEKLGATDLFQAEPVTSRTRAAVLGSAMRLKTRTLMKALLNTEAFREKLLVRAAWFKRNYPRLTRIGWIAVFAQPLITFLIMVLVHASVDVRVEMLVAMVIGIIAVDIYLIVISFLNASLTHQLALANLSTADLQKEARRQLGSSPTEGGDEQ
ncbi:YhgE/Pip domain-containing protein [Adlercreutzia equolifaciens]|uniref:YhgE/Pip domain-containing protein n=1 Tax=Adlercreutzia equolifaciens TaxID=446660 RepID=UPI0023B130A3|nr:YhgE/Pip domain-containing protein [Adlercreutzia equolifaciens]MDE8701549.1 YhgE/Pip domain-containing protein [Adlercreutzia equolifaciens]